MRRPATARLGRYELVARIAAGGMGEIFLARLEGAAGFEKLYVIKRILPHLADDARFRTMLIAEAQIAASMSHPNICQVYELDEDDGQLHIVMEYLEGVTLQAVLQRFARRRLALDYGLIAGVIQQTSDALHYAHELRKRSGESLGLVHRDVTPSNIFLTDGGLIKVLDFGIAKVKNAAKTQTGGGKGKYAYMAPEQLRNLEVDRRVDVFALGVVLFEMLALRRLFQRKTDYLTLRAVMEQPILDVRAHRPDVPEPLVDALNRALAGDRDARYATARELGVAVVEACSARSAPWGRDEIGEFVRSHFPGNVEPRTNLAGPAPASAAAIPLLPRRVTSPPDDDEGFSVPDSGGAGASASARSLPELGSGRGRPQLPRAPSFGPRPRPSSRTWALMVGAIGLVGVVLLVVRLLQPGPDSRPAAAMPSPAPGSAGATQAAPSHPSDPYAAALDARDRDLQACLRHRDRSVPPITKATVVVAADGRPKTVALEPSAVDAAPFGACVRAVLLSASFPGGRRGDDDQEIEIALRLR